MTVEVTMRCVLRLALVLYLVAIPTVFPSRPFQHQRKGRFEDYLVSAGRRRLSLRNRAASLIVDNVDSDDEDLTEGAGSGYGGDKKDNSGDVLDYFRGVPRSRWSCCMLGRLAGDRGFNCHAQYYKTKTNLRNRSRSRSRKYYGRLYVPGYGKEMMYMFQKCLARRSHEFHKCCYSATVERREMHRWHLYHEYRVSIRNS